MSAPAQKSIGACAGWRGDGACSCDWKVDRYSARPLIMTTKYFVCS